MQNFGKKFSVKSLRHCYFNLLNRKDLLRNHATSYNKILKNFQFFKNFEFCENEDWKRKLASLPTFREIFQEISVKICHGKF